MPDQTSSTKSLLRDLIPLWLLVEREILRQALEKHAVIRRVPRSTSISHAAPWSIECRSTGCNNRNR